MLTAALAPACGKSDSVVIVKVAADAEVAGVVQLRALVSNAGEGTTRLFPTTPAAAPITFETSFSLSVPRERTGALDIAIEGLDAGGAAVANGAGSIDLHVGDNVTITITLHSRRRRCAATASSTTARCVTKAIACRVAAATTRARSERRAQAMGGSGGTSGSGGTAAARARAARRTRAGGRV